MIELLLTCFPLILRIVYLRYRGRPVTLYSVHRALFVWMVLFLALIFTIEYYHPETRKAVIPFRVVPIVTERGGTVTDVLVQAGQTVKAGDLLFTIEDSSEKAAVAASRTGLEEVRSQIAVARSQVREAAAELATAEADLAQADLSLRTETELRDLKSPSFAENRYLRAKAEWDARRAEVEAARIKIESAQLQVDEVLPAKLDSAKASLNEAEVRLAKTRVHSDVSGRVEQLTLNVGARAAQFAVNPAMVIVPDRTADDPMEIVAGFSQTNMTVLHTGMPAEVACDSNINSGMRNSVLPARIVRIQGAIATGQLVPTGQLLQFPNRLEPGDAIVHLQLVYPEHEKLLVEGSNCLVQAYTTHISGSLAGTAVGSVVQAWALEKALIMRMKVWATLFVGTGLFGGS